MDTTLRCFELLKEGDEAGIRRLLETDPAAADGRDSGGVSLLMQALYRGRRELAETIADAKSQLDIFEAASLGRMEPLTQAAADAGAVAGFSTDGFTALHFACYFGTAETVRALLKLGAKADVIARNPMQVMPLHSAASVRNAMAARLLLEHGAPVNARQQGGWTPIHAAAQNGDQATIDTLLEHGADSKAINDAGQTPGEVARGKGHLAIAELLEK